MARGAGNARELTEAARGGDSILDAAAEVMIAGQQLVADRLQLLRAEVREDAIQLGGAALFVLASALLGIAGYFVLMAALVALVTPVLGGVLGLVAVGAPHVFLGVFGAWIGVRRLQRLPITMPNDATDDPFRDDPLSDDPLGDDLHSDRDGSAPGTASEPSAHKPGGPYDA